MKIVILICGVAVFFFLFGFVMGVIGEDPEEPITA